MDAKPLSLGKIFGEKQRFVVPVYQRTYEWTVQRQLEPLFSQIEEKAKEYLATGKVAFSHYMGALLLIPDGDPVFGKVQVFNVVDGQQRLTTFHILVAALHRLALEFEFLEIAKQLAQLITLEEAASFSRQPTERYKLEPTKYDRQLFRDLIDLDRPALRKKYPDEYYKNGKPWDGARKPLAAYHFFLREAEEFLRDGVEGPLDETTRPIVERRLLAMSTILYEDFRLIVITLAQDDDAQVIFETLNSGGAPLAAMDLVRNDVFHRALRQGASEDDIVDQWSIFEDPFWKTESTQGRIKKPRMDFFLAHVLSAETGNVPLLSELFAEYKHFVASRGFRTPQEELAVLTKYVPIYRDLVDPPADGEIARLARRLVVFDVSTAYPLIMSIAVSDAPDEVKDRLYLLTASYVIRRALCGLTPKSYNRTFVELALWLKTTEISEECFRAFFRDHSAETYRFPSDDDLRAAVTGRPAYGWIQKHRVRLILEELEFAARDRFSISTKLPDGLSIEHIMPQTWETYYPLPNGELFRDDHLADAATKAVIDARRLRVDTLPNLTLLTPAGNSSAGNQPFADKRIRLNDSLLKLNVDAALEDHWDEGAIARRAQKIIQLGLALWPGLQAHVAP